MKLVAIVHFLGKSFLHQLPLQALRTTLIAILAAASVIGAAGAARTQTANVLTQKYNIARTGAQLNETILTPANVTPNTFGRLYARTVDAQIIAQPLYVSNVSIPRLGVRNVVYVVTRANTVFAFDADSTDTNPADGLVWSAPVTVEAAAPVTGLCSESVGPIGVNSTPVIDATNNTMYLVSRRSDGTLWLISLDITTGTIKKTVRIAATLNGLSFNQSLEIQRTGLLLENGAIVIAFGALNCDNAGWHGWVLAYRETDLTQVGAFTTTSSAGWGGGVWQSGSGLAGDGAGNIYFITGNGSVNGNTDFGQMQKLSRFGPLPNLQEGRSLLVQEGGRTLEDDHGP